MGYYLDELLRRPESEHWRFAVARSADGSQMYGLREMVESRPAIRPPAELSRAEWRELVLARMRMHSVYQAVSPAWSIATPRQAVEAIESGTAAGEWVLDTERELILELVGEVFETPAQGDAGSA